MKLNGTLLILIIISLFNYANAGQIEDELTAIKARLEKLEQLVDEQNHIISKQNLAIKEKTREIEELIENPRIHDGHEHTVDWFKNIEIGGVAEVEASYNDPDSGSTSSDIVLATAELVVAAQVNEWVSTETTLLFEEDETDLEVDVAVVTIADPNRPWFITAGLLYNPYGTYETNLISDPLTLEIGETRESSVLGGFEFNGFTGGVYMFNGDLEKDGDDQIDNFGAFAGYGQENENSSFAINLGYINDIGDSDTLQDVIQDNIDAAGVSYSDHVAGVSIDSMFTYGPFSVIGEYLMAIDDFELEELAFKDSGAEPEAYNIEVGYGFTISGIDMTAAIAYQGTDEAVALELPEERIIAGLSAEIFESTALSIEWAHDEDYSASDGNADELGGNTITSQLAVQF